MTFREPTFFKQGGKQYKQVLHFYWDFSYMKHASKAFFDLTGINIKAIYFRYLNPTYEINLSR